mgnify:CR=1 FL=1
MVGIFKGDRVDNQALLAASVVTAGEALAARFDHAELLVKGVLAGAQDGSDLNV